MTQILNLLKRLGDFADKDDNNILGLSILIGGFVIGFTLHFVFHLPA
jgi:hypothetical protein